MSICVMCGKGPVSGRTFTRRGQAKKKGGVGRRTVRSNKRTFLPNLQRIKILLNGAVRRLQVCTACLKEGRVTRAPRRRAPVPQPTTA